MKNIEATNRNKVRIIAGEYRGRKLGFPDVSGLRPTADRVRETLFNWIGDQLPGETCLDMFSGSGALGFEAISRGAAKVVFVEKDMQASRSIAENIKLLEISNADLVNDNVLYWLVDRAEQKGKFGLVFVDPPFSENLLYIACEQLQISATLQPSCKIYIETAEELDEAKMPINWTCIKNKKAGAVRYYLYESLELRN